LKFLESPGAFVAAVMFAIFAFGVGLTSPIWLILDGRNPVEAMRAGMPVVTMTIVGLIVTVLLGIVVQRLRKPTETPVEPSVEEPPSNSRRDLVVHVVTMLMFIVPFLTIVLGLVLNQMIDFR
jgi:hypothetical protein